MSCDNPVCIENARKNDELSNAMKQLIHLQLISRDQEIGLRNTVNQLVLDRDLVQIELTKQFRGSLTWRIGSFFTWPFKLLSTSPKGSKLG